MININPTLDEVKKSDDPWIKAYFSTRNFS